MLLFAEVERLKKGKVQVEFGQVKWWVTREVAANEDLELKRDVGAGAMRVMNFWMVEVMRVQVSPSREKV